jgi:hypothetical protein
VCFSTAIAAGASEAIPEQEPWVSVPMPPGGQSIVLPVVLAGQSFKFACTSLPVHYFDESLRPQLGSVVGVKRIVGALAQDTPADVVKTPTLIVGSNELLPVIGDIAPIVDLSPVRQASGADIRGLLGLPFLCGQLVQFDFDEGVLRLAKGQLNRAELGTPWPLRLASSKSLWVDNVRVGDRTESFELALGNNRSVSVHNWLFKSLVQEGQVTKFAPDMRGSYRTYGPPVGERGLLSQIDWGGQPQHQVIIDNSDSNALGLRFLSRFVITLDVDGGRIYLRPGKKARANRPDAIGCTGITAEKRDRDFVVTEVRDNSSSAMAGVRVGDVVVSINGIPCQDMLHTEFGWRMDESRGSRLGLEIQRDGLPIRVSFDVPLTTPPELFLKEK